MSIDWDPSLTMGVEKLDAEHRHILRSLRHVVNAVSDGGVDEIRSALKFLQASLAAHWSEEERWMADAGYPAVADHQRQHEALLGRIAAARQSPDAARLPQIVQHITLGVDAHMRADDLRLGRFLTARENLRLLAEKGPGVGVSLTPIPGSLQRVQPQREREREAGSEPAPPPTHER